MALFVKRKKNSRGDIWISAVLYLALGVIVLTLILTAGIPVLNKLRDRNTIVETKNIMFLLDDGVKSVFSQGPGAQQTLILEIGKGTFVIEEEPNNITWKMQTKAVYSEINKPIREGDLLIETKKTNKADEFIITMKLIYSNKVKFPFEVNSVGNTDKKTLNGRYNLRIFNAGITTGASPNALPVIEIKEL